MTEPGVSPFSGSLDQVLSALANLAKSPAFAAEVTAYINAVNSGTGTVSLADVNGVKYPISYMPTDMAAPDLGDYVTPALAQVTVTPLQKPIPPFPILELVGMPGRQQQSREAAPFEDPGVDAEIFTIDAYLWGATADLPKYVQLEAMVLASCFKQLVRRNYQLGYLVKLIRPTGPVQALGSPPEAKSATLCAVALQRFEAFVTLP